jgi:hypothetical protein
LRFFSFFLVSSFGFACLFHHSVFYRFTFGFLLLNFFVETVPAIRGGWINTRWPQNLGLRWLHASRLSSCGLSFYRSLFFFFLLSFSFNSSFLLLSSGNRTAKLVPIPFCSRDLPERYLLLFLSPAFVLCSCVSFEILRKMAVTMYRKICADSPTLYRNNIREFPGR